MENALQGNQNFVFLLRDLMGHNHREGFVHNPM